VNDVESELEALTELVSATRPDYIQMRNLSLDPELYLACVGDPTEPSMGPREFHEEAQESLSLDQLRIFQSIHPGWNPVLWT
jgi:hypothetical protein